MNENIVETPRRGVSTYRNIKEKVVQDLIHLEKQGWQALSTAGNAARDFYSSVLAEDAVMLFPGGMCLAGKENILDSFAAQPWKSFVIEAPQVVSLSDTASVLVYRVKAQREGEDPYQALISSTYVQENGSWKLKLHQQTPE